MKKILLSIFIFFTGINFVYATNTLEFSSQDGNLYYNTDALKDGAFMYHTDMVPGKEYEDTLTIKNNASHTYQLYMKAIEKEQSDLANELLDNIIMKVYLDDKLIYSGKARGIDYNGDGVNLQNSIYIGEYQSSKLQNIIVKTTLDSSYENIENSDIAVIDWQFYASYDDEVMPIVPNTGYSGINYTLLIWISIIFLILLIIFFVIRNKKILKFMHSFLVK